MNVLVLGGTGPLGLCILSQLVEAKHKPDFPVKLNTITAVVRPESKKKVSDDVLAGLRLIEGSLLNDATMTQALENQNVIIVTVGHGSVCHESMELLNARANVSPAHRIVVVTSLGTNESYDECNFFTKTLVSTLLRTEIGHKKIQEDLLRSGPYSTSETKDYVLVRPGGLTDSETTGVYTAAERGIAGGRITRGNVAHFIVNELVPGKKGDKYSNKTFQLV
ncbi:hypothetical protein H310_02344 [Aphanomyces invadans]|uniref:NAD(P)-binding domain-containing protein n=1 Tax=Aphanomyces invadans TaxID=157072 RepID=A0A024UQT0_9STRA|nr:hypothetical protein H310_02344 [Aphanomyces invadans]ETW07958.1 hypothetical protein H310_02344 [Aphanomyces invadans]|eukprot:XP_008864051.1 hypothetical protein H310_02344 [Aphanomyces invadans]